MEFKMNDSVFEQICSLENLFSAWDTFGCGKHTRADVAAYELDLEDHLFDLRGDLLADRYFHDPYVSFTIHDPKQRWIHKATVKDRVVHQAIVNVIEPLFERVFIHDSYSCRLDKGTHASVDRLRTFLHKASQNNTRTVYVLKCDVQKFFASVNHEVLFSLLQRRIHGDRTVDLIQRSIRSFSASEGRGIPLGNLTSQLFANIYMNELDRFVKHGLREKYYLRYCDDFVIIGSDHGALLDLIDPINVFLHSTLRLALHPKKISIRTWNQGVDFVGHVLMPHATVLRTKTAQRMLRRADVWNVASYLGICGHVDAFEHEQTIRTKVYA